MNCLTKNRSFEIIQSEEQKRKRMQKSEERIQDLWDTIKWNNISIMEAPGEKRERERGRKLI